MNRSSNDMILLTGEGLSRLMGVAERAGLAEGFRAGEQAAYAGSLQARDALAAVAAPFLWPHRIVLALVLFALLGTGVLAA